MRRNVMKLEIIPPAAVIMRGPPGSGKSTFVAKNFPTACVASADHYFTDASGVYTFDWRALPLAHAQCRAKFEEALAAREPVVIVDNTNVRLDHFAHYVAYAKVKGYNVYVIRIECDPDTAVARNIHQVPAQTVLNMYGRMESYEGEIIVRS